MALLDRIALATAPREATRSDPVSMEEFGVLLGASSGTSFKTKSGVSISANRALGITAWYSGVRYLSESSAGLPWHLYHKLPKDERERVPPPSWLATPDPEQTWFGIIEHLVMSMCHRGNGYAYKVRNSVDQVIGLRELFPDRVTGDIGPDGRKHFLVDHDPTVYTTREIFHVPGLAYDCRFGVNPLRLFADALGTIAAADDMAGRWYGNNTHIGGLISVPQELNAGQAQRLREEWDQFHLGLQNAHKTGVLSKGATYQRITLSAEDAQLLEARQYGIAEVSRMLRIPPHKLYDLSRATFSNIEHQAIEAVTDSIAPWVTRIEAAVNADKSLVAPDYYLEATLEGMLRGDSAAKAAFYTAGVTGGWMMPSTPARKENLPAPPELDYYLRPLNMAVIRPGQPDETPAKETPA